MIADLKHYLRLIWAALVLLPVFVLLGVVILISELTPPGPVISGK